MSNLKSIPQAYSLELSVLISPDDAYDYYWSGHLKDKTKFKCPDPECNARYTCANMDKAETELIQVPHFRKTSEHRNNCALVKLTSAIGTNSGACSRNALAPKSQSEVGEFVLSRPALKVPERKSGGNMATNKYANSTNVVESIYSAKRKFYSIRPIVEKYFQLRENNIIDGALIKVKDKSFPFKSFFKGVYKQNIDEHRDYAHIYWGKGYIRRLGNSDGYIVFFEREMRVEESLISPSIIITEAALNAYPLSTRLKYYLNAKTIESNTKFIVFVYGIPCKKVINGNNHINFVIENLDFIDFRSTKYYEKLKRKAGAA